MTLLATAVALAPLGAADTRTLAVDPSLEAFRVERPSLLCVKLDDARLVDLDLELARAGS